MASEGEALAARVAMLQSEVEEREARDRQVALAEESRLMLERKNAEVALETLERRLDAVRTRVHGLEAEANALSLGTGMGSLTTLALQRSLAVTLVCCGSLMTLRLQYWWWAGPVFAAVAWVVGRAFRRRA